MDGTKKFVDGKLVALSADLKIQKTLSDGTPRRVYPEAVRYDLLLTCPIEIRYKFYETQLDRPVRELETRDNTFHRVEIQTRDLKGYYRPYVVATEVMTSFHGHVFHTPGVYVALPSLHPPVMTLDTDDGFKQEAFAFYLKTKVAVELHTPTSQATFQEWVSNMRSHLLSTISALHVVLRTSRAVSGLTPPFPNPAISDSKFEDRTGSTLPTLRFELLRGGDLLVVKGHCALSQAQVGNFTAAIDGWKGARSITGSFNGSDLVSLAQRLSSISLETLCSCGKHSVPCGWAFDAGNYAQHEPDGREDLEAGGGTDPDEDDDYSEDEYWVYVPSSDLEKMSDRDAMVPKKIWGIELARVNAS